MASRKEYLDYVLENLSGINVTYKKMMGEYLLYVSGRLVGGIYDDRLLIKPTDKAKSLMKGGKYEIPYESAKPMLLCDFIDDSERLVKLFKNLI